MYAKGERIFSLTDQTEAVIDAGPVNVLGVNYYWILLPDDTLSLVREDEIERIDDADRISMREGRGSTRRVSGV